jgi:signal transduction histidine kinase
MFERAMRVAAPAALASFVVIGAVQGGPSVVRVTVAAAMIALLAVIAWIDPTGWRLVGGCAVVAVGLFVICHQQASSLGWFGAVVIAAWTAYRAPGLPAAVTGAALVAGFAVEWSMLTEDGGWGAWISGTVLATVGCTFARRQRVLVEQLSEAQAGLVERTRAEERNRIAAEMHDVIGHAMTVSLLHVSSARLALDEDPDEARAALAEAERLARQSLDEVRGVVGLMRGAGPREVVPLPGGTDVTDLVDSFRRAGTRVQLHVSGGLDALGATHGLAVYRVVQESLTNAARHGDGTPVSVRVDVGGDRTTVTIDSGRSSGSGAATGGAGLIVMNERVQALGGKLLAGPRPGGWRVEAVLPL